MEVNESVLIDKQFIDGLNDLGDGFVKEIVELYIEQAPSLLNAIQGNSDSGNSEEMFKAAHTLKGASLNIGAILLADIAKELEMKGRENNMSNSKELVSKLLEAYDKTIMELKQIANLS